MKVLSSLIELVDSFSKLPSVGPRSAERLAYAVLNMSSEDKDAFIKAFIDAKAKVHLCPECGLYTEEDKCEICLSPDRDKTLMCVVATVKDAFVIEKTSSYNGLYHVLGGLINISKGVGVSELNIDKLLERITALGTKEVILATNPTLEGETTALFIAKLLENKGVTTTRLAYGLPIGSSLDYADPETLAKSFEGRRKI